MNLIEFDLKKHLPKNGHSNFCDLIDLTDFDEWHIWRLRRRHTTGSARPKLRSSAKFEVPKMM